MAHTPGPWHWEHINGDYHYLQNESGQIVHTDGSAGGEYGPDIDVYGDDARLIAAAPDLLKACEASLNALRSYQYGNSSPDLAEEIANYLTAVIGKAKGNES